MSRNKILWLYFIDSKYGRHQNQIFLLMMVMRCSKLGIILGLILKLTDTKIIPAVTSSSFCCRCCLGSHLILEVPTKSFASRPRWWWVMTNVAFSTTYAILVTIVNVHHKVHHFYVCNPLFVRITPLLSIHLFYRKSH